MTKLNEPINAIGKMMVFSSIEFFKLGELYLNLRHLGFTSTVVLSVNLMDDLKEEVFQIKSNSVTLTYVDPTTYGGY